MRRRQIKFKCYISAFNGLDNRKKKKSLKQNKNYYSVVALVLNTSMEKNVSEKEKENVTSCLQWVFFCGAGF